jgi:hypothetical protein
LVDYLALCAPHRPPAQIPLHVLSFGPWSQSLSHRNASEHATHLGTSGGKRLGGCI